MSAITRPLRSVSTLDEPRHEPSIEAARLKFRIREYEFVERQIRKNASEPRRAYCVP
jgi:hypothetical protein